MCILILSKTKENQDVIEKQSRERKQMDTERIDALLCTIEEKSLMPAGGNTMSGEYKYDTN